MTNSRSKIGKDIIANLAGDSPAKLVDRLKSETRDITEKNLSDSEIITRLSCFKSVSALRSGMNVSIDQVLNEANQVMEWVKSR
jgi:hypothetical protein